MNDPQFEVSTSESVTEKRFRCENHLHRLQSDLYRPRYELQVFSLDDDETVYIYTFDASVSIRSIERFASDTHKGLEYVVTLHHVVSSN